MTHSFTKPWRPILTAAAFLAIGTVLAVPIRHAAGEDAGADVRPVAAEKLPNVPGKSITAIVVSYAPGGKSGKHHHAGSVLAYVLSGAIRSENSATGPAKAYKTRDSVFEPAGSKALVRVNAMA